MEYKKIIGKFSEYFHSTSADLAIWIEARFSTMYGDYWWRKGVSPYLEEYHQNKTNITKLDLSTLIKIVDKNWVVLEKYYGFMEDDHKTILEMRKVRNFWAHAPVNPPSPLLIIDHLHIVTDFINFIDKHPGDAKDIAEIIDDIIKFGFKEKTADKETKSDIETMKDINRKRELLNINENKEESPVEEEKPIEIKIDTKPQISNSAEPTFLEIYEDEFISSQNNYGEFDDYIYEQNYEVKIQHSSVNNTIDFDTVWENIKRHEGDMFVMKMGDLVSYSCKETGIVPLRDGIPKYDLIPKSDIKIAFNLLPLRGPGQLNDIVRGPSYLYAILSDKRIISIPEKNSIMQEINYVTPQPILGSKQDIETIKSTDKTQVSKNSTLGLQKEKTTDFRSQKTQSHYYEKEKLKPLKKKYRGDFKWLIICFLLPYIGIFLYLRWEKSNPDNAALAKGGTIAGFIFLAYTLFSKLFL